MIYLKDEATGVTVEDEVAGTQPYVYTSNEDTGKLWTHAEADALLRGLLRWKLEQIGSAALYSMVRNETSAYMKEPSR